MHTAVLRLVHPASFMIAFWLVLYIVYAIAPVEQTPEVGWLGSLFVWSLVAVFAFTAAMGSVGRVGPARGLTKRHGPDHARLVTGLLLLGIASALLGLQQKLGAIADVGLLGAAALRAERAQQLIDAEQMASGVLSGLSFLTYPAGFVGIVATLIRYERYPRLTRTLLLLYVPVIFLHNIVSGGRSTILVAILFVGLSIYIRRRNGLPAMPRSKALRRLLWVLVAAFLAYSTIIWQIRSELSDMNLDAFLGHAEQVWGATPTRNLERFAEWVGQPGLVQSVLSTTFYFTQCLSVGEKVVAMPTPPLLFGGYQIDLVAVLYRVLPGGAEYLREGNAKLLDENIYGFFTGAWGALYIDFGLIGAVLATALWGWLSGRAHRSAKRGVDHGQVELYVYALYGVLVSFVSPPLGFSNSCVTFLWFLAFAALKDKPARRPLLAAPHPAAS